MTPDFLSRWIGLIVFAVLGARFGADIANFINMRVEDSAFIFGLVGVLFGVIATPWFTVRPVRFWRQAINELPIEKLLMALIGGLVGLTIGLLAAYPLSLLDPPIGTVAPSAVSLVAAYLGITIFSVRSRELIEALESRFARRAIHRSGASGRELLLDTSVLIDGRIVEIAETGFLGGTIIIPRFVLNELHRVADSSDQLRRNRGRRGLAKVNELQRSELTTVKIIEDDIEEIADVDNKLVALCLQRNATLVTNDFNLNQVAEAQGVPVLNVNLLANAVRSIYIPGETFAIRIIQEGRDDNQGVGYLDDGTMVVVANGKSYMDRTINVEVTRLINRETGRMIFAVPEAEAKRGQTSHHE